MSTLSAFEVIIIGSGAGGAAAAYRLALAGVPVLLLEKGLPLPLDGSTLDDEKVVTQGAFLSKERWVDGHGNAICPEEHFNLGGKTKWYGAAVLRYSQKEFEPNMAYAVRGWPISADDLAPYYDEAERLLGARTFACEPGLKKILDRLSALNDSWHSVPIAMALAPEIVNDPVEAHHFDGFASAANLKGDAQTSFLKWVQDRPNLVIRTGCEVASLLPAAADGARVAGVLLTTGEELRAPVVMLAAGALHSPRILRRYVDATGLASLNGHFDGIGRNLKKHVLTAMVAVSFAKQTDLLRKTMLTTHSRYPHSSVQPLGFDGILIANLVPKWVPRFIARLVGNRAYGFFLQTEDGSHPDNRVREEHGVRIMDYDATRNPASVREHGKFTRALQRDLLRIGMLSFTQRIGLNGTAHIDGTLVAGTDPTDSVVDRNGVVFGIEGLYVVDGSILPRSSRVNPSLSIYAWGLRVADLLIKARTNAS